jgi:hypothetical protein
VARPRGREPETQRELQAAKAAQPEPQKHTRATQHPIFLTTKVRNRNLKTQISNLIPALTLATSPQNNKFEIQNPKPALNLATWFSDFLGELASADQTSELPIPSGLGQNFHQVFMQSWASCLDEQKVFQDFCLCPREESRLIVFYVHTKYYKRDGSISKWILE